MTNGQATKEKVREDIKRLIAELTEREPGEITNTALFVDDLGVDSLKAIEILVTLDKRYQIDIPEAEFHKLKNVNDTADVVLQHLSRNAAAE